MRCALLCVVLAALSSAAGAADAKRPNIILFVTDDMGADAGCYGNPVIKTPHLDALAKGGIRLTHAFCTTASCSASRSVILTGLFNHANAHYGHAHAYHHFSAYKTVKSLPVLLAEAGYRTGQIGKLHVEPPEVFAWETRLQGPERNPVVMANNCKAIHRSVERQAAISVFLHGRSASQQRATGRRSQAAGRIAAEPVWQPAHRRLSGRDRGEV